MKMRRRGLIGKITNMTKKFVAENEAMNIGVGKIQDFFGINLPIKEEKQRIFHINIYLVSDYNKVLELINQKAIVIANYSFLEDFLKDKFVFELRKALMIKGLHLRYAGTDALICAPDKVEIKVMNEDYKGKIIKFPENYRRC